MATLVVHKRTGQRYVLVGTAAGLVAEGGAGGTSDEALGLAFVCGPSGSVKVVRALDLIVVEVDGHTPGDLLAE
jgi:hypothetical protein